MRRYTLDIKDREFVIDVQELAADRFEVFVDDKSYVVTLSSDENLGEATITPGLQPESAVPQATSTDKTTTQIRREPSSTPAATPSSRKPLGGPGSKSVLTAPMPGVILEINVTAGDQIERGEQVAILDAMKMHNVIGAPRAGAVAEVCVQAGQQVDHGDAIIRFKED